MDQNKYTAVVSVGEADFDELTALWEASVRATHDFVSEQDICSMRPLVRGQFLPAVEVYATHDEEGKIVAFIGVDGRNIEMLFVHPSQRGKGWGRLLVEFAQERLQADRVEANEQNPQAVGFYFRMGFRVIGRDELDPQGNPFPILHMEKISEK